ncbi:MAG: GtrA family protein [Eubacteriales bacterium]|nr:GtrA family protein [Eubacteriales bacterium]
MNEKKTNQNLIQKLWSNRELRNLFLYLIVGGLATIVEWACFWVFDSKFGIHYMIATALAFVFSTFANWLFGRLLVFQKRENFSVWKELAAIYATSIGGLLFNLAIMYVLVEWVHVGNMIAKIIATGIVFIYNYVIRKVLIYKQ